MENNTYKKPNEKTSIKDKLLSKISSNDISMRPKIYFTGKLIILGILSFIVLVISVFIFNFILFSIHAQATDALLGFGPRGILPFLAAFPWMLLIIDIIFIAAFQWILRKFHHGYRKPILIGLIGIFIVTIVVGVIIDKATPVNDFLHHGDPRFVPSQIHDLYLGTDRPPRPTGGTCLCIITSIGTSTITAENALLGSTTQFLIIIPLHERHATTSSLSVGDTVMIAGDQQGNIIRAFGIHKIEPVSGWIK